MQRVDAQSLVSLSRRLIHDSNEKRRIIRKKGREKSLLRRVERRGGEEATDERGRDRMAA